jgi:hypothetical protein
MNKGLNRAGQGVFGFSIFVLTQGTARDERIHRSPRAPDVAQRLRRRGEEEAGADARRSRPEGGRDRHIDVALFCRPSRKADARRIVAAPISISDTAWKGDLHRDEHWCRSATCPPR